ncbi:MAG TPA: hypothetical protein VFV19_08315 [Candidatus Polarisedimenticolaceae bacterium]|nr:hypothetical protein [Candidatus Polarisedimenticolaceae bacterium]
MKTNWPAVAGVGALALGLIAYKGTRAPLPNPGSSSTSTAAPVVVLIADPAEAEESCGCGEIIRAVRAAAAKGVSTREVAPGADLGLEKRYGVKVSPTVLFIGTDGTVRARHEGEDADTVDAIHQDLDRALAGRP